MAKLSDLEKLKFINEVVKTVEDNPDMTGDVYKALQEGPVWNTRPIEDALRLRIAELEESDKHWAGNVKVCMQLIERYESDIAENDALQARAEKAEARLIELGDVIKLQKL